MNRQVAEPPFAERLIQNYASRLRESHRFALDSQEHVDHMLTWAIGLMGAAILGSQEFIKPLLPIARVMAVLPWIFGIGVAIAGRFVARNLIERENMFFFQKVTRMESAPLRYRDDEQAILKEVQAAMTDQGQEKERSALNDLRKTLTDLYYATHILLGLGLLTVMAFGLQVRAGR